MAWAARSGQEVGRRGAGLARGSFQGREGRRNGGLARQRASPAGKVGRGREGAPESKKTRRCQGTEKRKWPSTQTAAPIPPLGGGGASGLRARARWRGSLPTWRGPLHQRFPGPPPSNEGALLSRPGRTVQPAADQGAAPRRVPHPLSGRPRPRAPPATTPAAAGPTRPRLRRFNPNHASADRRPAQPSPALRWPADPTRFRSLTRGERHVKSSFVRCRHRRPDAHGGRRGAG